MVFLMKASELINLKTEMLEPLYVVAEELTELDEQGKAHRLEFTNMDVIAASVVFLQVLANRKAHFYLKEAVSTPEETDLEKVKVEMTRYGERIKELVKEMTGVNLDEKESKQQRETKSE